MEISENKNSNKLLIFGLVLLVILAHSVPYDEYEVKIPNLKTLKIINPKNNVVEIIDNVNIFLFSYFFSFPNKTTSCFNFTIDTL